MISFALVLIAPAAVYLAWSRRRNGAAFDFRAAGLRAAVLLGAGCIAASPFLTSHGVGSGEAYNYALSVADAVVQMRAGELPVLVGQTEYAFNGRIHPLRNAPYLFYLCRALDLATLGKLGPWALQNLSATLSVVAAFFACYGGLRWSTGVARPVALFLTACYGFAPGFLAITYGQYMLMSVHAAAFLPLVFAACARQSRESAPAADLILAAALAAAWLAHPPVAMWTTLAAVPLRAVSLFRRDWVRQLPGLLAAAASFAVLSSFVFASVHALSDVSAVGTQSASRMPGATPFTSSLLAIVRQSFPASILPVSSRGDAIGDMQLGYVGWILLGAAIVAAFRAKAGDPGRRFGVASIAVAVLLLCLALPIPGLTAWLWENSPEFVRSLTNSWPMQRVYLPSTAAVLFAAAMLVRWPARASGDVFLRASVTAGLACAWLGYQALPFLRAGWAARWSEAATVERMRPENLDLTVTSYAFLGLPAGYVNGAVDPAMTFRMLPHGVAPGSSLHEVIFAKAGAVEKWTHGASPGGKTMMIEPGLRYALRVSVPAGAGRATLQIAGPSLSRSHMLEPGDPAAHKPVFTLWTSAAAAETVAITLIPARGDETRRFDLEFAAARPEDLPVRLASLHPFKAEVRADADFMMLETPRRFIPGYTAMVNGAPKRVFPSKDGSAMVSVPRGASEVELRFDEPRFVRIAFWICGAGWLGFIAWIAAGARPRSNVFCFGCLAAGGAAVAVLFLAARPAPAAAHGVSGGQGPIRLTALLPTDRAGVRETLVSTGKSGAGTAFFVHYVDAAHIRLGVDVWGTPLFESEPVEVNYYEPQTIAIEADSLYPAGAETTGIRVGLNGREVIRLDRSAFPSTEAEIGIGRSRITNSGSNAQFTGEILSVQRLSPPAAHFVGPGQSLELKAVFPESEHPVLEPLLVFPGGLGAAAAGADLPALGVERLPDGSARLRLERSGREPVMSEPFTVTAGNPHVVQFAIAPPAGNGNATAVVRVDGRQVLGPFDLAFRTGRMRVVQGMDPRNAGRHFSGSLSGSVQGSPPTGDTGAFRFELRFPQGKPPGTAEPLVTTGRTQKGDIAFVVYVDPTHVRFGVDHWGVGGATSEPVEIDYAAPHEVVVSMGSLYPDDNDARWGAVPALERQRRRSTVEIRLDGRVVLAAPLGSHPTEPGEVVVGRNPIGGSSTNAPVFSGSIEIADRLGVAP